MPRVGSMNSMIWRGPSIEQGWVVGNTMSDGLGLKELGHLYDTKYIDEYWRFLDDGWLHSPVRPFDGLFLEQGRVLIR